MRVFISVEGPFAFDDGPGPAAVSFLDGRFRPAETVGFFFLLRLPDGGAVSFMTNLIGVLSSTV
jgi:hypothetical protein